MGTLQILSALWLVYENYCQLIESDVCARLWQLINHQDLLRMINARVFYLQLPLLQMLTRRELDGALSVFINK